MKSIDNNLNSGTSSCRSCVLYVGVALATLIFIAWGYGGWIGVVDWSDSASYQALGRFFIERGTFYSYPLPYSEFTGQEAVFPSVFVDYPNIVYAISVGVMGFLRDNWTLTNGVMLGMLFTFVSMLALCRLMLKVAPASPLAIFSCCIAFMLLLQEYAIPYLAYPDVILLSFFLIAVACALESRMYLAGAVLGVGFLFREHGLMFLPFLTVLQPDRLSLRRLASGAFKAGLAFLPFFILYIALKFSLNQGQVGQFFYKTAYSSLLRPLSASQLALTFASNIWVYFKYLGPLGLFAMLLAALRHRSMSSAAVKILVFALPTIIIPSFLLAWRSDPNPRYGMYAFGLFLTVSAMLLQHVPKKILWVLPLVLAVQAYACLPSHLAYAPGEYVERAKMHWQNDSSPKDLSGVLSEGSIVMSDSFQVVFLAVKNPRNIALPAYDNFYYGQNNHLIDAIFIAVRSNAQWIENDIIADASGNIFYRYAEADGAVHTRPNFSGANQYVYLSGRHYTPNYSGK